MESALRIELMQLIRYFYKQRHIRAHVERGTRILIRQWIKQVRELEVDEALTRFLAAL